LCPQSESHHPEIKSAKTRGTERFLRKKDRKITIASYPLTLLPSS